MLKSAFRVGSLLAVLVVVGTSVINAAEDRPPAGAYRAKQVLGSKVSIDGGMAVGTVDDVVYADDGQVEYFIVNKDNRLVTVPWQAATFDFDKRTAVVKISPDRYKEVPTYTVDKYPGFFTPAYRTETYRHYGLTPRETRRIDRRLDR